jgi:hypothetical protein
MLPGEPATVKDEYDRLEQMAAAILDSEFTEFEPEGILEEYLGVKLYLWRLEHGLIEFPTDEPV